jgi:hypothetical protein
MGALRGLLEETLFVKRKHSALKLRKSNRYAISNDHEHYFTLRNIISGIRQNFHLRFSQKFSGPQLHCSDVGHDTFASICGFHTGKAEKEHVRHQERDVFHYTMSVTIGSAPACTLLVLNDTDSPLQMVSRNNLCDPEN